MYYFWRASPPPLQILASDYIWSYWWSLYFWHNSTWPYHSPCISDIILHGPTITSVCLTLMYIALPWICYMSDNFYMALPWFFYVWHNCTWPYPGSFMHDMTVHDLTMILVCLIKVHGTSMVLVCLTWMYMMLLWFFDVSHDCTMYMMLLWF